MTDPNYAPDDWSALFTQYRAHQQAVEEQKKRGANNFNLLKTVLKPNDEVRLHSRVIAEFLNPSGSHAQGDIFLKEFLQVLGEGKPKSLKDFLNAFDTQNATVKCERKYKHEHERMDIYLTDDERHIIIENKLDAGDQEDQALRYINQVRYGIANNGDDDGDKNFKVPPEKCTDGVLVEGDKLLFIYLTKNRESPTSLGHGNHSSSDNKDNKAGYAKSEDGCQLLANSETDFPIPVAWYANAHYFTTGNAGGEIPSWIDRCLSLVNNITNLNYALTEYKGIVERINYNYRSKLMGLKAFIFEGDDVLSSTDRFLMALEIEKKLPDLFAEMLTEFLREGGTADKYLDKQFPSAFTRISKGKTHDFNNGKKDARDFFNRKKEAKDKGVFWQYSNGNGKVELQYTLAIMYGKSALHIGLIPNGNDEQTTLFEASPNGKEINCKKRESTLLEVVSWKCDCRKALIDMVQTDKSEPATATVDNILANFEKSPAGKALQQVINFINSEAPNKQPHNNS